MVKNRLVSRLLIFVLVGMMATAFACGGDDALQDATPSPAPTSTSETLTSPRDLSVQAGDTVSVHYHGTLDDGVVFDSSREREPLTFVVGSGQVIPGFDKAVLGLSVGDTVVTRLEADEAYGPRLNDLIVEVPRSQAPDGLRAGDQVQLANGARAIILEVTDEMVRIDANHPLAGRALTFEIELISIERGR